MDDSIFARLGYDPVRIFTQFNGGPPPPQGIAQLGNAPATEAPPGGAAAEPPEQPEPDPAPAEAAGPETAEVPPPDGGNEVVPEEQRGRPEGGGGGSPSGAAPVESTLHQPAAGPPPRSREEPAAPPDEPDEYKLKDWLAEHYEEIAALVLARQGPGAVRPAEPEPEPEPDAVTEPDDPPPIPYVAPGDRWTKWKMSEFLRQLAATHSVTAAAKAVKMSRNSAYKLRNRLKGQPFDVAWEAAFRHGYDELAMAALELALEGEEVPHYYQGELKATPRKRNPQLMVQLLKMRNRYGRPMLGRYNAAAEFWSENWDSLLERLETGAVDWSDEKKALTEEQLEKLDLPDAERTTDLLIQRNLPDEPRAKIRPVKNESVTRPKKRGFPRVSGNRAALQVYSFVTQVAWPLPRIPAFAIGPATSINRKVAP